MRIFAFFLAGVGGVPTLLSRTFSLSQNQRLSRNLELSFTVRNTQPHRQGIKAPLATIERLEHDLNAPVSRAGRCSNTEIAMRISLSSEIHRYRT